MSEANPQRNPIPQPKADDHEDVSWALSTAEATWNRGDRADALKWLRRAAEAASEAEADDRALELAKAAAEIATTLEESSPGPRSIPISMSSRAPAAPATSHARSSARPPMKAPPLPKGAHQTGKPEPKKSEPVKPKAPAIPAQNKTIPKAASSHPSAPRPPQRLILAPPSAPSEPEPMTPKPSGSTGELPSIQDSTPDLDDTIFRPRPGQAKANADESGPMTPRSRRDTKSPAAVPADPSTDDLEAWPTQSMAGSELPSYDGMEDKTRIGTPAYRDPPPVEPSQRPPIALRGARPSQAVRVVVWRGPDGVHVAPHGTTVTAISVDAMLVALDPSADLSAWLANK